MSPPLLGMRVGRLESLDALRGLLMVVMAIDHTVDMTTSDGMSGKEMWTGEPAYEPSGGSSIAVHFLTRFVTDMCAPGFCFLMGVSMPMLAASRERDGWSPGRICRFHLVRALVLLCPCHVLFEHIGFMLPRFVYKIPGDQHSKWSGVIEGTSVLFSLSAAMAITALTARVLGKLSRLLRIAAYAVLALVVFIGTELAVENAPKDDPTAWGWFAAVMFLPSGPYLDGKFLVLYTILPWLGYVYFGCAVGEFLQERSWRPKIGVMSAGAFCVCAALFAALRAAGGFGNFCDGDKGGNPPLVAFFDLVKYPPSLVYSLCTLSMCFAALAWFELVSRSVPYSHWSWRPLLAFGRAPLFYYLAHIWVLALFRVILGPAGFSDFWPIYLVWLGVVVLLYKPCVWYGTFKASRPVESIWRLF